jgi:UDP-N-acetylmuramoyl-L-alanyl-D-glutamate--2,6-diaminopimelate ligase
MHKYALTKLKFLQKIYCKNVVINIDDKYGALFQKLTNTNLFTFGINSPAQNFAIDVSLNLKGCSFLCSVLDNPLQITSNLTCMFNVYNILGACVVSKILDISNDCIVQGIAKLQKVEGRMNCFKLKNNAHAIIDFAHTPDGLKKVLESLKELIKDKRLITVFGCGGDRDKSKRRIMGEIASKFSNIVIVTSDNPRSENPQSIIKDIISCEVKKNMFCQEDRKKAIKMAYSLSKDGDIILIAGKGAENYQEINGLRLPYSDLDEIKKYIQQ